MSPSTRQRIDTFAYDINDDLDNLFSDYMKVKKRYQYWNKQQINLLKKKSTQKELKSVIKEIKQTFNQGVREFNKAIIRQQKLIKELKEHKLFLLQRKVLWKGGKFES